MVPRCVPGNSLKKTSGSSNGRTLPFFRCDFARMGSKHKMFQRTSSGTAQVVCYCRACVLSDHPSRLGVVPNESKKQIDLLPLTLIALRDGSADPLPVVATRIPSSRHLHRQHHRKLHKPSTGRMSIVRLRMNRCSPR
jgi:hypothetical protein